jgi:excisionase family DNA binding protein
MVSPAVYQLRMSAAADNAITWWLIDDVCAYLQMSADQIGRLVRNHGLPHRDFGGVRRYPKELVEAWAEQDVVVGARKPRSRRWEAGRPAAARRHGAQARRRNRTSAAQSMGVAAMPG